MNTPRAILFDLGETLLHFAGVNRLEAFLQGARAGHAYLVARGLRLDPVEQFLKALVSRGKKAMLLNSISRREVDIRQLFILATGVPGVELPPELWAGFVETMYEPLAKSARLDPQTRPVVTALRDAGIRVALVSNTFVPSLAMEDHLQRLGIRDLFEHRFYSSDVGLKKPSLSVFRVALGALGVARPRDAWHVGDELVADVLGARRAGMISVLRLHGSDRIRWWWPIKPHRTIHELARLLDMAGVERPDELQTRH